jgi:hypothetical protein
MEVGHDDGNLQSITGCEIGAKPRSARNLPAQELSEPAVLAESRRERLTPPPS